MFDGHKYLTTAGIAQRANVDKETVRRWCRESRLPAFKVGKEWITLEEDVLIFLRERSGNQKQE